MKFGKNGPLFLLAFQLLINVCHVSLHHFALNLLWLEGTGPSGLSKLLIYAGGLSCIAFVGIIGSRLQGKQKSEDSQIPDIGAGKFGSVLSIIVSFAAEGLTQYLVQ